ncbi:TetR/AcrR family transcriptional regulator [Kitasatospora sp. NBC_00315]|uniref:TetR/AcrR family transcriptional regulator n=1 Tax=Kitasatospora sp. NBC_00315 TaxID=2975963 RepID=UPI0032467B2B
MDLAEADTRVLDAAEELFYERGVQVVGMDEIRAASGVSLKRLYQLHPSKSDLVRAYLERRDTRWRADLARYVEGRPVGEERLLAVFDRLYRWFSEPSFRGCAFVNSFGELGAVHPAVAEAARAHKNAFRDYLAALLEDAGKPAALTAPLLLLAEGAMVTAAVSGTPEPAREARQAAAFLLAAAHYPATADA